MSLHNAQYFILKDVGFHLRLTDLKGLYLIGKTKSDAANFLLKNIQTKK